MEFPIEFKFNGASIPGWAKSVIGGNYDGPYLEAALVHDGLYDLQYHRPTADQIFYDLMGYTTGNTFFLRRTMYKAVRLGGKDSWGKPSSINTHLLGKIKIIKSTPDDPMNLKDFVRT